MTTIKTEYKPELNKRLSIYALRGLALLLIASGTVFSIYSIVQNVTIPVFGVATSGAVFGALVVYLGIRNFLSVGKLKTEVYKPNAQFSFDNFKKRKVKKVK
ncbi:MAG: hypothetical protein BGN88_13290 [Clostridiales bacterium 43-6]|nr:MAG: hypothetical protein BGN88_13290 [Clostridiales bacterium 43-6]